MSELGSDAVLYVWYKDPQAPSPRIGMGSVTKRPTGRREESIPGGRRDESEMG